MIYWIKDGKVEEFPSEMVEFMYSYYVPKGSLIVHVNDQLHNIDIPNTVTNIVFDSSNPWKVEDLIKSGALEKTTHILTGILKYHKNQNLDSKIQFFPFWLLWMSNPYGPFMPMGDHTFSTRPKKHLVSCLNGTQWTHRKLTYLSLYKKSYFSNMIFSFNQRKHYGSLPEEDSLTDEELAEFNILPQIVKVDDNIDENFLDLSTMHPAYSQTYINLVTETTVNIETPMLSEKTFKPIVAGQLFVLIASPGCIQFLRNVGIDTFDDLIDHSYDQELDLRTRINLAVSQVDRLVQLDLDQLYTKIKPRLLKNSEYFRSQQFRDQFKLHFG